MRTPISPWPIRSSRLHLRTLYLKLLSTHIVDHELDTIAATNAPWMRGGAFEVNMPISLALRQHACIDDNVDPDGYR